MKILVTGATGFIGSHFAEACLEMGDVVHTVARPSSDLGRLPGRFDSGNVHIYDGSLVSLLAAMREAKPDAVVHLASLFVVRHSPEELEEVFRSNILFGSQLLEAMSSCEVRCFVNTGSSWQHFESGEYNPVNLYAATKKAFADILAYYVEARSLRAVTLELPDTYGPNDQRRKIVNLLLESIRKRTPLDLTEGQQVLDLVHVDDVVEAYRAALRIVVAMEHGCATYSVSSGQPRKLADLVHFLGARAGAEGLLRLGAQPYRFREVMNAYSGGVPLPGWRPRRNIEEFLAEQISANS